MNKLCVIYVGEPPSEALEVFSLLEMNLAKKKNADLRTCYTFALKTTPVFAILAAKAMMAPSRIDDPANI